MPFSSHDCVTPSRHVCIVGAGLRMPPRCQRTLPSSMSTAVCIATTALPINAAADPTSTTGVATPIAATSIAAAASIDTTCPLCIRLGSQSTNGEGTPGRIRLVKRNSSGCPCVSLCTPPPPVTIGGRCPHMHHGHGKLVSSVRARMLSMRASCTQVQWPLRGGQRART